MTWPPARRMYSGGRLVADAQDRLPHQAAVAEFLHQDLAGGDEARGVDLQAELPQPGGDLLGQRRVVVGDEEEPRPLGLQGAEKRRHSFDGLRAPVEDAVDVAQDHVIAAEDLDASHAQARSKISLAMMRRWIWLVPS